jgi:uncharacterized protein (DUF2062 family)
MEEMLEERHVEATGAERRPGAIVRVLRRIACVDTPHRVAAAFALGVFLSFSPLLGLQTLIGLSTAFALRLSRVAVFAGLCTNLPWIMVPWYALTTWLGAEALRTPLGPNLKADLAQLFAVPVYHAGFWSQAAHLLAPFFWAFVLGSTAGAVVVGTIAYFATAHAIVRMIAAEHTAND